MIALLHTQMKQNNNGLFIIIYAKHNLPQSFVGFYFERMLAASRLALLHMSSFYYALHRNTMSECVNVAHNFLW